MNKFIPVLGLAAVVAVSGPAHAAQKMLVRLPERTVVMVHTTAELNSSSALKDDYVSFIVDRDIIENGYILIHGGSRGMAQIIEVHPARGSGHAGGIKLNFVSLCSSDSQQIPVDGVDASSQPDRDTGAATAMGIVAFGAGGLFFHNLVNGSDAGILTTHKGYITVLGSHMIAVDSIYDLAPPNSPNSTAAMLPGI